MNPRLGVLLIALAGLVLHGLVLAWGSYANKILYIIIPAGLTCLAYVYLGFPLTNRRHYRLYLPFIAFIPLLLFGICAFLGFLVYAQVKWPNYWREELTKMLDGIANRDGVEDSDAYFNTVNYSYMGALVILFLFNLLAFITVQIAFRNEARRCQKLVLPPMSEYSGAPYTNLDVNGPSGAEQLWTVKL